MGLRSKESSNVKVQMPKKFQISKVKSQKLWEFDIHLIFACLTQAGILKFDIASFI
jgi:hypothetical protein